MKRVFLMAALLAVALLQPAGAWIPVGQTSGTGGVLYVPTDSWAGLFDPNSELGGPQILWNYPTQVGQALGLADPVIYLHLEAHQFQPWSGPWNLSYAVPGRTTDRVHHFLEGTLTSVAFAQNADGTISFAADLLATSPVTLLDGTQKSLSDFGITNHLLLTGTLTFVEEPVFDGQEPDELFYRGAMVLSVQPVPEPVFFQMGALMGLSGLGLLRLRRKA